MAKKRNKRKKAQKRAASSSPTTDPQADQDAPAAATEAPPEAAPREASEDSPVTAPVVDDIGAATVAQQPSESGLPSWTSDVIAGLILVVALVADGGAAVRFEGLLLVARVFGATGAGLWLAARRLDGPARTWLLGAAAVALVAAAAACFGRNPQVHQLVFDGLNGSFLGLPSQLGFVLLALGYSWRGHPAGRSALALGLVWATAVVLLPDTVFGEARWPLANAFALLGAADVVSLLRGLTLLSAVVAVGAGWVFLVRRALGRATHAPRLVTLGLAALVVFHALAPMLAGTATTAGLLVGLLLLGSWRCVAAAGARPALSGAWSSRLCRARDFAVPVGVLALFVLIKTLGMGPSNTDENIYFYMARDLADGRWPYVDYFFAHPPLHVVLPGLVFSVVGYSFGLAKLFSVGAAVISGACLWGIGRRHYGRVAAVMAMVLFLFASETLKASTNMTGINLTVMWLMLGVWQSLKGRGVTAGVFFGLAATTGFYSMAAICAFVALGFFRWPDNAPAWRPRLRFGLRQLGSFLLVFGLINVVFWAAAGDAFLDGVYRYHGLKAFRDAAMVPLFGGDTAFPGSLLHNIGVMVDGREFRKDAYYHAYLWIGLFAAPLLASAAFFVNRAKGVSPWRLFAPSRFADGSPHGVALIVWLAALTLFVQYAMFRELYSFYWVLIYPFLALSVAYAVTCAARLAVSVLDDVAPRRPWRLATAVAALLVVGMYRPWTVELQPVFPEELQQVASRNDYVYRPAPVLGGLSGVVHTLFWEDHRLRAGAEPGFRHYLWNKTRRFVTVHEIADWIRENSGPDETIAGASTSAPLVALTAERRLAAGEADTNNKRFKTGMLKEQAYWEAICADNIRYIVATPRSYFTRRRMEKQLKTARTWFRLAKIFKDPELRYGGTFEIAIYERTGDPPGDGVVCRWED